MSLYRAQIWPEGIATYYMARSQGILSMTAVLLLVLPCSRVTSKGRSSLAVTISAISPHGEFFNFLNCSDYRCSYILV